MRGVQLLVLAVAALAASSDAARVVCYYSSWAVYRQGAGHFEVEDIDPTLCTHIVYAFAKLSSEGELQTYDDYNDVGDDWHEGQFLKLQDLRPRSPKTKIMIAVGGWNHGPETFQETVVKPAKRQRFVDTTVAFCRKYGFDGLDIDWEYQDSAHGGTPEQLAGFNELLRMFRTRFNKEGLILSAATPAGFTLIEQNWDLKVLSNTADFINLMAYDLHGAWETFTGHQAALHPMPSEKGADRNLNVEAVVKKYIERGADPAKINIGIPLYGRGFTLANPQNNGLYAATTGPSPIGPIIPEAGLISWAEICQNKGQWQQKMDKDQKSPYAVNGNYWYGYENLDSVQVKIDYLKTLGVKNYMVWSVETDDVRGACGQKYGLLRKIVSAGNA